MQPNGMSLELTCQSDGWTCKRISAILDLSKKKDLKTDSVPHGREASPTSCSMSQHPIPDTKSNIAYLVARSAGLDAHLLPMGTVSKEGDGMQLSEMRDLAEAGAVAFSDDAPISGVEMLRRALEYAQGLPHPIVTCPLELGLNAHPQMHEGITSTHMGVVRQPRSETMRIKRDLDVLRYAGGKLHFSCISSAESVELIERRKRKA